jgi:anti-sigma B factor antagonist
MLHHQSLQIHERENQGIVVLDLRGKLELGGGEVALRDFVQSLLTGSNQKLALNLAHISEIDSSGVGALLFLAQEYRNTGGKIALFNIAHTHGQIYEMARLETAIEIYQAELDAINSFFPDRATAHYDILDYVESQPGYEDPHKKQTGAA